MRVTMATSVALSITCVIPTSCRCVCLLSIGISASHGLPSLRPATSKRRRNLGKNKIEVGVDLCFSFCQLPSSLHRCLILCLSAFTCSRSHLSTSLSLSLCFSISQPPPVIVMGIWHLLQFSNLNRVSLCIEKIFCCDWGCMVKTRSGLVASVA